MERLSKRIDGLEITTRQIQQDVAVLSTCVQHLATKADLEVLRNEQGLMRLELTVEIHQLEQRMDEKFIQMAAKTDMKFDSMDKKFEAKFDSIDKKFDRLNDRLTWTIMLPAILAVLAWFIKVAVLKI